MHKKAAIKNLARTLPITVAVVRLPVNRSGSISITSPKICECIANIAPNRKVCHGSCRALFSQLLNTKNEEVARLNQHMEGRPAFPTDARSIVEPNGQQKYYVPPKNARPNEKRNS